MHEFFFPFFQIYFQKKMMKKKKKTTLLALEHKFQQKLLCTQNNIAFERQIKNKKQEFLVEKRISIFYCEILLRFNIPLNFLF